MASTANRVVIFLDHPLAAVAAGKLLAAAKGIGLAVAAPVRPAGEVAPAELDSARFVVGFVSTDAAGDCAEVWPADESALDAEVADLLARLFSGAKRGTLPPAVPIPNPKAVKVPKPPPPPTVKVSRETKGRRGKGVTIISDLPVKLGAQGRAELAATLKSRCGTGGTVTDDAIEIQGDMRERVAAELAKLGYKVKHAGG